MLTTAEVALIFDTDGTLLDGRQTVVKAVARGLVSTYHHFDLQVHDPDLERISQAVGLPATEFFRTAFDPESVPIELRRLFADEFEINSTRAEVSAIESGRTSLFDGTVETLSALAERGHPLALFSNSNARYFEAVVRVHQLDRFFSHSISLEDAMKARVAHTKAGIVKHLAQGYTGAVVIGDRIHDIEAGRSIGAHTVGCLFGFGKASEFAQASWTINSLQELLKLPLTTPSVKGATE